MCGSVLARGGQGSGCSGGLGAQAAQSSALSWPQRCPFLPELPSAQRWQGLCAHGPGGSGICVSAPQLGSPRGFSAFALPLPSCSELGALGERWLQRQEPEHKMRSKINQ